MQSVKTNSVVCRACKGSGKVVGRDKQVQACYKCRGTGSTTTGYHTK